MKNMILEMENGENSAPNALTLSRGDKSCTLAGGGWGKFTDTYIFYSMCPITLIFCRDVVYYNIILLQVKK